MNSFVIPTPLLNNNEDIVMVVAWHVEPGSAVAAGQALVTLETTKVASDVEAVESGFLRWCGGKVGDMLAVNSPLAVITKSAQEPFDVPKGVSIEVEPAVKASTERMTALMPTSTRKSKKKDDCSKEFTNIDATIKAKILAQRLGIDLTSIGVDGRVTSKDLWQVGDGGNLPQDWLLSRDEQLFDLEKLGAESLATVIVGDGAHAQYVMDTVQRAGTCNVIGFTSVTRPRGALVAGLPVLGSDSDLPAIFAAGVRLALVGIGSDRSGVRSNQRRADIFCKLKKLGFILPAIVDPDASISSSAKLGEGALVAAGAVVSSNVRIGANCLVNVGCIVCHDAIVEAHVHLTPGAILAGTTRIGELTTIGMGATLLDGVSVGRKCLVLNNARVISDVPDGMTVGAKE